ncbi:MAG: hypothetical protein BRC47_12560 [Cyanobacteria bacterium QS_7_48_42]|nr:MAG: hypothetical protein BRC36_12895 [Cyanobacteria bacterium QH_2_48_84]PSP00465.1 MAG: hypothetical protein BRC47_12560 [Cyanobacteria bacterium QS_7_48_42]PSP25248.1 MAG: hypothetical protein BRC55_04375 [Cyanobacteria bacterium SW_8_48_13]PSP36395.1 MAG: hypothetical protein BRC57_01940 [Cyanobacteria bacterium QS_8_48_54]
MPLLLAYTANHPGRKTKRIFAQISATVGILLAITSIGLLIYFIQHAVSSIQAGNIIDDVGTDLDKNITLLFPKKARYNQTASRGVEEIPSEQES